MKSYDDIIAQRPASSPVTAKQLQRPQQHASASTASLPVYGGLFYYYYC